MARNRIINAGIWQSQDFSKLSLIAKLVFIGLFSQADDEGRGRANATYIRNTLFPYNEKIESSEVKAALDEIAQHMSIQFYSVEDDEYYVLTRWKRWQKINRPSPSYLPPPPGYIHGVFSDYSLNDNGVLIDDSVSTHGGLTEDSLNAHGISDNTTKATAEMAQEIIDYLNEKAQRKYNVVESYIEHISKRFQEKATLDDFKKVIDVKVAEWNLPPSPGKDDMRRYLRPETLFSSKFWSYLNQEPETIRSGRKNLMELAVEETNTKDQP